MQEAQTGHSEAERHCAAWTTGIVDRPVVSTVGARALVSLTTVQGGGPQDQGTQEYREHFRIGTLLGTFFFL